ncbi:hypothetical protein BDZ97DRAFT_655277 [Flammula alnicola]|nr:hypothetical protein BDZ97DRAFT_655277 [Flammula alnicola]
MYLLEIFLSSILQLAEDLLEGWRGGVTYVLSPYSVPLLQELIATEMLASKYVSLKIESSCHFSLTTFYKRALFTEMQATGQYSMIFAAFDKTVSTERTKCYCCGVLSIIFVCWSTNLHQGYFYFEGTIPRVYFIHHLPNPPIRFLTAKYKER